LSLPPWREAFCYFDKPSHIKQYTLHKGERLKKRNAIEHLFQKGKTFGLFPLRIYYLLTEEGEKDDAGLKAGFSVSKRHFKKAVDRNRIKRLVREAYRLQKLPLQNGLKDGSSLHLFFIYTGKELPDYNLIKEKTAIALQKLEREFIKQQ
jgi:ribonuclease P protein component